MKSTISEPKIHDELAEFYSLWRDACLHKKASEHDEVNFLLKIFASSANAKTIIDLGGCVGLHAIALAKHGFDVTLLDSSKRALDIAKRTSPSLKTVQSNFDSIAVDDNFDISISMLSSANHLLDENDRESFYSWIKTHINHVAVFDQLNILSLPKTHTDSCHSEDKHFRFNVLREWHFEGDLLHTSFVYEFVDKASEATKIMNDSQVQKFISAEELVKYMGKEWRIVALLGDCDLKQPFDPEKSPRMIAVFKKQN